MKNEQHIRDYVMRRVYALYVMRLLMSPASRALVLGVSLLGVALSVSIPNVILNMPSFLDIANASRFFAYAFLNTHTLVQVLLVIATTFIAWTGVDIARAVSKSTHRLDTAVN